MLALKLTNLKDFMNKLLVKESFDAFWLSEATITTNVTFHIDGTFHPEFYEAAEREQLQQSGRSHISWKYIRGHCFSLIKGKRTPLHLKVIFLCPPSKTQELLAQSGAPVSFEDIFGLVLNLQYDGEKVTATTGVSYRSFTLDKTLERTWDTFVKNYFIRQEVEFEEG